VHNLREVESLPRTLAMALAALALVVPLGLLVVIAVVALVVGNLAATVPARSAGRVQPAAVLRTG
jgi:ABC-type lipoprotein release transport system permease subunit